MAFSLAGAARSVFGHRADWQSGLRRPVYCPWVASVSRGRSLVGRAPPLHGGGPGFESPRLHLHVEKRPGVAIDILRVASSFAIDLVYPKRCAGCAQRGTWLCDTCDSALDRFVPPWCTSCGVPQHVPCECAAMPEGVDRLRSGGPFDGWLSGAVSQCKYHGEWGRAEHLAELLAGAAADLQPFAALVPVPLHPTRLRQRGFNQSQLLAEYAARMLGVPVEPLLRRIRRTDAQVHLGAAQRHLNVHGAMQVQPGSAVLGKSFVIVDDVVTTGSTLAACAAALRDAGAVSVQGLTVAREL